MTRSVRLFPLVLLLLLAMPVTAQVRSAPDGNALPQEVEPYDAAALPHDFPSARAAMTPQQHAAFAQAVDVSAFRKLAVFDNGRAKIIDTLARERLERIYGRRAWTDPTTGNTYDPVFTFLDMIFNESYYADKPLIYVEVLPLRQTIVSPLPADEQDWWLRQGRLSPQLLARPDVRQVMESLDADVLMQQAISRVRVSALTFRHLGDTMNMVSPAPGSEQWAHVVQLRDGQLAAADGATTAAATWAMADPQVARIVLEQFGALAGAWRQADADGVNHALTLLSRNIPLLNPGSYPSSFTRDLERLYNATRKFTIGYVGYFLATVVLLIALAVHRRWLVVTGAAMLLTGFAVHSAGIAVRTILSGRWPIHNQYESYIAVTWFAVLVGIVFMFAKRQWLFGAAAAALGACSLLLANQVAIPSRDPGVVAGILATSSILYIHVNIVLFSYGLIGLGFFIALFYLAAHYLRSPETARLTAAGMGAIDPDSGRPLRGPAALLNDLDKAHLVVLQLAFWLLGVGILLGAYWADHAWGRWWAWDPKETWALITWIVYLAVIHLRFVVRNRGLVTAWMSVLGFFIMLWTYWGVNLLLAGLHSYA